MAAADETNPPPTPAAVLAWVAAAGDRPWFPLAHCQATGVSRDAIDEPLHALRQAGLVRVSDWVKGLGQGYAVTPPGAAAADDPAKLAKLLAGPPPERAVEERPTTFDRGEEARQAWYFPRPPLVVQLLIAANVVWFAVGLVLALRDGKSANAYLSRGDTAILERLGAVSAPDLVRGEWWRLLSSAFVHIGGLHLLVNMYSLASIGGVTESIWGRRRFVVLYLVSAIGGGCLAMGVQPTVGRPGEGFSVVLLAGASGAIWGLMASLVAWLLLHRQHLPPDVVNQSLRRLAILFVLNVGVSFVPGVSWAGHFGGGILGFLAAVLFSLANRHGRVAQWVALVLAVLFAAGAVSGLRYWSYHADRWKPLRFLDVRQQLQEFVSAMAIEVRPIEPSRVDTLFRQVVEAARLDPTKRPELPAMVAQLKADAQAFAEVVAREEQSGFVSNLPDHYRDYAAAVESLADAMLDVLRRPDGNLTTLKERKKAVGEKWILLTMLANFGKLVEPR